MTKRYQTLKIFLSLSELFLKEASIGGSTRHLRLEASRSSARNCVRFLAEPIVVSDQAEIDRRRRSRPFDVGPRPEVRARLRDSRAYP